MGRGEGTDTAAGGRRLFYGRRHSVPARGIEHPNPDRSARFEAERLALGLIAGASEPRAEALALLSEHRAALGQAPLLQTLANALCLGAIHRTQARLHENTRGSYDPLNLRPTAQQNTAIEAAALAPLLVGQLRAALAESEVGETEFELLLEDLPEQALLYANENQLGPIVCEWLNRHDAELESELRRKDERPANGAAEPLLRILAAAGRDGIEAAEDTHLSGLSVLYHRIWKRLMLPGREAIWGRTRNRQGRPFKQFAGELAGAFATPSQPRRKGQYRFYATASTAIEARASGAARNAFFDALDNSGTNGPRYSELRGQIARTALEAHSAELAKALAAAASENPEQAAAAMIESHTLNDFDDAIIAARELVTDEEALRETLIRVGTGWNSSEAARKRFSEELWAQFGRDPRSGSRLDRAPQHAWSGP